jgi:hypothetical protein
MDSEFPERILARTSADPVVPAKFPEIRMTSRPSFGQPLASGPPLNELTRRANHLHKFMVSRFHRPRRETGRGFFASRGGAHFTEAIIEQQTRHRVRFRAP